MSVKIQQQLPVLREASPRPPVDGETAHIMQIKMDGVRNSDKDDIIGDGILSMFEVTPVLNYKDGTLSSTHCPGNGSQKPDYQIQTNTDFSPCTEHSTPPYFKWAQDLHHLLMDIEGVNLFKKYLTQERCETRSLDFWFACEGLKKADPKKAEYIQQVIRLIYKKFVKKTLKEINLETKQDIAEKISSKLELDQAIFDIAQKEVEEVIMKTTYPNFLKSDIYLQHIQLMQNSVTYDSPKTDGLSSVSEASSSTNSRDGLDILPTLHEDAELQMEPSRSLKLDRKTFGQHSKFLESSRLRPEAQAGHYLHSPSRMSNSCHVKYASFLPSSAQDSELQSLSSDAHTDDTLSLTDSSSVDCGPVFSSKSFHKKQRRAAKRNAIINKDHLFHHNFIPRTQRLPKESTMQMEPAQLAAILIDKLTQVKKDQDAQEKIAEYLYKIEGEERSTSKLHVHSSLDCLPGLPSQLLTVAMKDKLTTIDESDQSILDQHVSRVWSDSTHHTPNRSPGHHSPPLRSHSPALLDRRRSAPVGGNVHHMPRSDLTVVNVPSCHNTLSSAGSQTVHRTCRNIQYTVPHHNSAISRHKKERDTYSSDSGTVHDFTPENEPVSLPHQTVYSHKHSHHYVNGASVPPNLSRLTPATGDQYNIVPNEHHIRKNKENRRSGCKKASTTDSSSSCVDSGVSVACDPQPLSVSARERVYNWVLDNEKYSSVHGPDSEKDSSSRHKKASHSTTSPVLGRPSHTKKPVMYNSSRSGTLEHGTTPWPMLPAVGVGSSCHECAHASHSCAHLPYGVQPSQPVAQDLSMPILPPPDTTTQLVEARRRLQDEARGKQTKIKVSSCGRERQSHVDIPKSRMCSKIIEVDENFTHKKSAKKSHFVNIQETTKSVTSEVTVIGYCFGSEPVPYLTKLPGRNITLKQFKSLLSKKGNYRYFFKKASDEFGTGVVFEEILEDNEILPLWEGKIFANIEVAE